MTKPLVPDQLLPPGVKDERQEAFVRALNDGLKEIDISSFVMSDMDTVQEDLLPFLVREYSLQEFVSPGMRQTAVRALLKRAHELHDKKGYVAGTKLTLNLVGLSVQWTQWWEEQPKAQPNTHKIRVYMDETLIDGSAPLDANNRLAISRLIDATKRWSQDISVTFTLSSKLAYFAGTMSAIRRSVTVYPYQPVYEPSYTPYWFGIGSAVRRMIVVHPRSEVANA